MTGESWRWLEMTADDWRKLAIPRDGWIYVAVAVVKDGWRLRWLEMVGDWRWLMIAGALVGYGCSTQMLLSDALTNIIMYPCLTFS